MTDGDSRAEQRRRMDDLVKMFSDDGRRIKEDLALAFTISAVAISTCAADEQAHAAFERAMRETLGDDSVPTLTKPGVMVLLEKLMHSLGAQTLTIGSVARDGYRIY